MICTFRNFAVFWLIAFTQPSFAQLSSEPSGWADFSRYGDNFRLGLEVEIGSGVMLENFHLFDWQNIFDTQGEFLRNYFAEDFFDLYFESPENYERLPKEIQNKIDALVAERNISRAKAWQLLPLATKAQNIEFKYMSKRTISRYFWTIAGALKISPNAPAAFKQAMQQLTIVPDNAGSSLFGVYEFTHRENFEERSPKEYLKTLKTLIGTLGLSQKIDTNTKGGFSYHIHISSKKGPISEPIMRLINFNFLAGKLAQRATGVVQGDHIVGYKTDMNLKGVIRRIADDRIELRTHYMDPVHEVEFILKGLNMPEKAGIEYFGAALAKSFTAEMVKFSAERNPAIIFDFVRYVRPTLSAKAKARLDIALAKGLARSQSRIATRRLYDAIGLLPRSERSHLRNLLKQLDPNGAFQPTGVCQRLKGLFGF